MTTTHSDAGKVGGAARSHVRLSHAIASHPVLNRLLSPTRLGAMELSNRIVMAPMGVEIVGAEGRANEALIRYYEERARGGVGLIITEVCAVAYPRGANSSHQLGLSDESFIPALRELTDRIHAAGSKIALQLVHHGKMSRLDIKQGREVLVPSRPDWPGSLDMIGDLSDDELQLMAEATGGAPVRYRAVGGDDIAWVIERFAGATARARDAGFDGVEIHAAHGYLLSSFLSAQWNRRDDEYGGSLPNRARLLCEVIANAKQSAGDDYPVWCRLDALEYRTPSGITFTDTLDVAVMAQRAGADAIHLSAYGDMTSGPAFSEGTIPYHEAPRAAMCGQLRRHVDVPIIAVGRISPEKGDEMIAAGDADLIAMGRQLLADPALAEKLASSRRADIRPCINCYVCVAQPFFDRRVRCAVNPVLGHEEELAAIERERAPRARRVIVVGAGPAGLEAARVAASRGHQVTLFEATETLGGSLRFAGLVYEPNRTLLDWMVRQVDAAPIEVRLRERPSAAQIAAMKPDVVVVATGAARDRPRLSGSGAPNVMDGDDLRALLAGFVRGRAARGLSRLGRASVRLGRAFGVTSDVARLAKLTHYYMPLGRNVVVIGGGLVGIELAEFLVHRDRHVTVLEEGPRLALEMAHPRRWRVLHDLRAAGTTLATDVTDIVIDPRVVHYRCDDDERTAPADHVVVASGLVANESMAAALRSEGIEPVVVGDCTGVGYIEGAIRDGFLAAAAI